MTANAYPTLRSRVTPALLARFEAAVAAHGSSNSAVLKMLVVQWVQDQEAGGRKLAPPPENIQELGTQRFEIRLPEFLKSGMQRRAKAEGVPAAQWAVAIIQSILMKTPVMTDSELEVLRFANRELAAVGRNLNQVAKHMNQAALTNEPLYESEKITLSEIQLLSNSVGRMKTAIYSLVRARNRAWGVSNDRIA